MGIDNDLPWPHLSEDMRHFREFTRGKTVIMGRRTYESIGRALPHRQNIVLSHNPEFCPPDAEVCPHLDAAIARAKQQPVAIGGADLFRLAIARGSDISLTLLYAPESWRARPKVSQTHFPLDMLDLDTLETVREFSEHGWRAVVKRGCTYRRKVAISQKPIL